MSHRASPWLCLAVLGLPACDGGSWCERFNLDCVVEEPWLIEALADEDGDGWTDGQDCDDANPLVNPSASEFCDGVDNNCDGVVDEGTPGLQTWWPDEDGDGWGDVSGSVESCQQPAGHVADSGDCDDEVWAVNPGVSERCDEVDWNCDGDLVAEAVDALVYFEDADGDGFGDPLEKSWACEAAEGQVLDGTDCDDTDAAIYPGAAEWCGDEVDSNCSGDEVDLGAEDGELVYQDSDGDGYGDPLTEDKACAIPEGYVDNDGDCNDFIPYVHPGASECTNEIDDDCNGLVDDEAEGPLTWYQDQDGDGYGSPFNTKAACWPTSGYVSGAGDCDDLDGAVNPDATEVCDGVDNDCDLLKDTRDDSLDLSTVVDFYEDTDGDGYGDAASVLSACTLSEVPGYVDNDGDCDDTDASINPGAEEICGTGVVEDCDLSEAEAQAVCQLEGVVPASMAWSAMHGTAVSGSLGVSLEAAGDLDGDGLDEVWAGEHLGLDASGQAVGRVLLFSGGVADSLLTDDSVVELLGEAANDYTGGSLARTEDQDGDGYDDLFIGAPSNDWGDSEAGTVWLWSGPVTGSVSLVDEAFALVGTTAGGWFGSAVVGLEEPADSGEARVAVGAPGWAGSGSATGAAYVFAGPISSSRYDSVAVGVAQATGVIKYLGEALDSAGDTDGDGYEDLILGAPQSSSASTASGAAALMLGPLSGTISVSAADCVVGNSYRDYVGWQVLGLGDRDGDGRDDVAIGAPGDDISGTTSGSVWVVLGPVTGGSWVGDVAWARIDGEYGGDYFGAALESVPDLDGDGQAELFVGAPYNDSQATNAGRAYLVTGLSSGVTPADEASTIFEGKVASGYVGFSLVGGVELDDDGLPDFVLGASGLSLGGSAGGGAVLGFGRDDY